MLCSIVVAELLVGVHKCARPEVEGPKVFAFISGLEVFDFAIPEAETYGLLRADLERRGSTIGANDLLIAATALTRSLTLVTHNTDEFGRVPDLKIEDWCT